MAELTRSQVDMDREQHIRFRLGAADDDAFVSSFTPEQQAELPPVTLDVPFASAAQAVDVVTLLGSVPVDGTVTEVRLHFSVGFTGAATDTRTFTLSKVDSSGQGATKVAEAASVGTGFTTGFDEGSVVLPIVDGTVHAGDGLRFNSTHIGAGKLHSAGVVTVTIK